VYGKLLDRFFPRVHQQFVHLIVRGTHTVEFGFKSDDSFRCIIDHVTGILTKLLVNVDLLEIFLLILLDFYIIKAIKGRLYITVDYRCVLRDR